MGGLVPMEIKTTIKIGFNSDQDHQYMKDWRKHHHDNNVYTTHYYITITIIISSTSISILIIILPVGAMSLDNLFTHVSAR